MLEALQLRLHPCFRPLCTTPFTFSRYFLMRRLADNSSMWHPSKIFMLPVLSLRLAVVIADASAAILVLVYLSCSPDNLFGLQYVYASRCCRCFCSLVTCTLLIGGDPKQFLVESFSEHFFCRLFGSTHPQASLAPPPPPRSHQLGPVPCRR